MLNHHHIHTVAARMQALIAQHSLQADAHRLPNVVLAGLLHEAMRPYWRSHGVNTEMSESNRRDQQVLSYLRDEQAAELYAGSGILRRRTDTIADANDLSESIVRASLRRLMAAGLVERKTYSAEPRGYGDTGRKHYYNAVSRGHDGQ